MHLQQTLYWKIDRIPYSKSFLLKSQCPINEPLVCGTICQSETVPNRQFPEA